MDEAIREIVSLGERPWDDSHHRFLISELDTFPLQILSPDIPKIVSSPYTTIQTLEAEGNMGNISKTLLINISNKTGIVENIQIGADCNLGNCKLHLPI